MFKLLSPALGLVVGIALTCEREVEAATYYVSGRSPASDNSSGDSPERAFASISQAIERAGSGDRIVVLAGDYRHEDSGWGVGVIPITKGGTEHAPLRIQASGEALVAHFLLKNVQHVHIEGFTFRLQPFSANAKWRDMPSIVRDLPADSLTGVDFSSDWEKRRETIEKSFATYLGLAKSLEYQVAIEVQASHHITLAQNSIDGYWAGIQLRGVDQADIRANRISHCVSGIFTWEPAPALTRSRVRGNIISQCLDIGIDIRRESSDVVVEWNRVSYCGVSHIALLDGTRQSCVRYNLVSGGGYYSQTMEFPGSSAINLNTAADECTVEFNLAANQVDLTEIDGNGIIVDLSQAGSQATVRGNLCLANMGSGLNTTASPDTCVYGNVFCRNGLGGRQPRNGAGIKLSRDQDVGQTITYNLFAFNRTAGILSYHTLSQQRQVNRNCYLLKSAPIAWDGFEADERAYYQLSELQSATGWENAGLLLRCPLP